MAALKVNMKLEDKNNSIKSWLKDFWTAATELAGTILNSENEEYDSIDDAINVTKKENPEETVDLDKISAAIKYEAEKLEEQSKEKFEKIELEDNKDKDGYNQIPNKLKNIEKEVPQGGVLKSVNKERAKGGKQKTRVDED